MCKYLKLIEYLKHLKLIEHPEVSAPPTCQALILLTENTDISVAKEVNIPVSKGTEELVVKDVGCSIKVDDKLSVGQYEVSSFNMKLYFFLVGWAPFHRESYIPSLSWG